MTWLSTQEVQKNHKKIPGTNKQLWQVSSKLDPQIQCNSNQNFSKLFCGYWQIDSKIYIKR